MLKRHQAAMVYFRAFKRRLFASVDSVRPQLFRDFQAYSLQGYSLGEFDDKMRPEIQIMAAWLNLGRSFKKIYDVY